MESALLLSEDADKSGEALFRRESDALVRENALEATITQIMAERSLMSVTGMSSSCCLANLQKMVGFSGKTAGKFWAQGIPARWRQAILRARTR